MARPSPAPQPDRPLCAMLGLQADASVSQLRFAYERAMANAVRGGDNQRALALSRAFDALSSKQRVYSGAGVSAARFDALQPTARRSTRKERRAHRLQHQRTQNGVGRLSLGSRIIVYLFLLPVIAASIAILIVRSRGGPAASNTVPAQPTNQPANVVSQPTPSLSVAPVQLPEAETTYPSPPANVRRISADAPVNAQGYVSVICRPGGPNTAYVQLARPGSIVTCANGATPRILG